MFLGSKVKACYGDSFTLWRQIVLPVRYELDCKYCYNGQYLTVNCEPIVYTMWDP
jgi:hypothetical protein